MSVHRTTLAQGLSIENVVSGVAPHLKIAIVGAGLIGVTTAYFLRRCGHEVIVIERNEAPGQETSFANGSLLTPSTPEPWNAPGSWRVLLSSLGRSDAALQLRMKALPSLGKWGIEFLRNSGAYAHRRNTLKNLRLALHSLEVMTSIRQDTGIEYGRTARGTLKIFRRAHAFERAAAAAELLASQGLTFRRLTAQATIELEPALVPLADQLVGAIHCADDEAGDARRFCVELAKQAQEQGVEFKFTTAITAFEGDAGHVARVVAGHERITADRYVVAAGSYGAPLLKQIGIRLPVQPAKGYSVTFDRCDGEPLRIPVIDDDYHAAVVPFGTGLRVAGTAEFAGYDLTLRPERIRNLLTLVEKVLPGMNFDPATAKPWCGLRPMSSDGVPIIGTTPMRNLFLNTGHGHLGWTMAAGSAQLLADLIDQRKPALEPSDYALGRFGDA